MGVSESLDSLFWPFSVFGVVLELDLSPSNFSVSSLLSFVAQRTPLFVSLISVYVCLCAGPCAATPGQGIFLLSIQH